MSFGHDRAGCFFHLTKPEGSHKDTTQPDILKSMNVYKTHTLVLHWFCMTTNSPVKHSDGRCRGAYIGKHQWPGVVAHIHLYLFWDSGFSGPVWTYCSKGFCLEYPPLTIPFTIWVDRWRKPLIAHNHIGVNFSLHSWTSTHMIDSSQTSLGSTKREPANCRSDMILSLSRVVSFRVASQMHRAPHKHLLYILQGIVYMWALLSRDAVAVSMYTK